MGRISRNGANVSTQILLLPKLEKSLRVKVMQLWSQSNQILLEIDLRTILINKMNNQINLYAYYLVLHYKLTPQETDYHIYQNFVIIYYDDFNINMFSLRSG